jgi:hypothetical protein
MKNRFNLKRLLLVIFLMVNTIIFNFMHAQEPKPVQSDPLFTKSIGTWEGNLLIDTTKLPLVFKIKKNEQQKFVVTLDSPSQKGFNFPLGDLSNEAGKLKIDAPSINGYYIGKFLDASTLDGTWSQNGASLPLRLIKKKEVK